MMIKAYAKMNLSLKVNGVLENGYHDLTMINTKINLFDKIYIKKSKKDLFRMIPELCDNAKNIAYISYIKLKEKFNIKNCYSILIKKNIPSGAGLGGGSADAASIINEIIKLENIDINKEELIKFALSIGADVPYCLFGNKCLVKGIGEIIEPTDIKNEWNVILASPGVSFETRKIFALWKKNDSGVNLIPNIANSNNITKCFCNDLEKPAKLAYSDYKLDEVKENLIKNGSICSLMTGSGSTIFGLFDIKDKKVFNKCEKEMKKLYPEYKINKYKTISY